LCPGCGADILLGRHGTAIFRDAREADGTRVQQFKSVGHTLCRRTKRNTADRNTTDVVDEWQLEPALILTICTAFNDLPHFYKANSFFVKD